MRKPRFWTLLITVLSALIISIIGYSSWLIVTRQNTNAVTTDVVAECECQSFVTSLTYADVNLSTNKNGYGRLALTDAGKSIFGASSNTDLSKFTITLLDGESGESNNSKFFDGRKRADLANSNTWLSAAGIYAGEYHYKIVETATGQLICADHVLTISQREVELKYTQGSATFVGKEMKWTGVSLVVKGTSTAPGSSDLSLPAQFTKTAELSHFGTNGEYTAIKYAGNVAYTHEFTNSTSFFNNNTLAGVTKSGSKYVLSVDLPYTLYGTTQIGSKYYANIDTALAAAVANTGADTIVPLQSFTDGTTTYDSLTHYSHVINSNVTIDSGDTLLIPYDAEAKERADGESSFSPVRTNLVTVANGIAITNNGTITVAGVLGHIGQTHPAGATSGKFAVLAMGDGSSMNNGSGSCLKAFGYVTDPHNTAKIECLSGSTVYMPFVVYDFGGGTHTTGAYLDGKIAPFNMYDMPNIHALTVYSSGAIITGEASMSANSELHKTQASILGVSESLINLTSGKVTIKHTPYQGAAFGTTSNNSKPSIESENEVKFEGNMTTGALKLDLSAMLGALGSVGDIFGIDPTADMSKVICPISHKFKIIFAGRGPYTITSAYKLMPGSEVIIESGSTVNMNGDLIVYSDAIYSAYYSGSSVVAKANVWKKNPNYRPGAILTVNGQLNVNAGIGGEIRTASSGAVLNLNGSTNLSVSSNESNGTGMTASECIYTETQAANGIAGMSNAAPVNANLAKAEYTSVDYGNGIYGWKQYKVNYSWIFENNTLSDSQIDNSKNPEYYSNGVDVYLQIPTSANPNESPYFEGWYLDAECNTSINKLPVGTGDITVYGKWVDARTYMVSFKTDINCGNASVSIGDYAVAPDASFDPYNYDAAKSAMDEIAQAPSIDHYFVGWYYDEALTNPVPNDGIAQVTDDVVLYAKWAPKAKLTVKSGVLSSIHIKTDTDMYKAEFDVTPPPAGTGVYYVPGSTLTLKATHSNGGKHNSWSGSTTFKAAVYIKDDATDATLASGTASKTAYKISGNVTAEATATYTVTDAGDLTLKVTTANTY